MKRVLITGGRAPVALDLARIFSAGGAEVFVADSAPCFLARSSRAVAKAFRVPPPRHAARAFADAILGIIRRERIDLVVPTCEEVFYLSRYAQQLRESTRLFCPNFELMCELHDKWRFTQLARDLGVEVPETWLLRNPQDIADLPVHPLDLVFKPVFSRFAVHTMIRPQAHDLARCQPGPHRHWVAQRFIEGRERCSYSVACRGTLTAHALYEPSWRAGLGSGYYFRPVSSQPIETFVKRLVAKTNYTGQLGFDFIEGAAGDVHVLECNPRATSGVHLFSTSDGLDRAFDGTAGITVRPGNGQPGMLVPAMLFLGVGKAMRQGRGGAFASDWAAARDVLWSRSDPLPAFYLFAGLSATLLTAARRGISPQAASTRDIEWDGEELP